MHVLCIGVEPSLLLNEGVGGFMFFGRTVQDTSLLFFYTNFGVEVTHNVNNINWWWCWSGGGAQVCFGPGRRSPLG